MKSPVYKLASTPVCVHCEASVFEFAIRLLSLNIFDKSRHISSYRLKEDHLYKQRRELVRLTTMMATSYRRECEVDEREIEICSRRRIEYFGGDGGAASAAWPIVDCRCLPLQLFVTPITYSVSPPQVYTFGSHQLLTSIFLLHKLLDSGNYIV